MTFDDHAQRHFIDGVYDLEAAATSRADEILAEMKADPAATLQRAAKAQADSERRRWENRNADSLRKRYAGGFEQLSFDDESMRLVVLLGDNIGVELGEMTDAQILIRVDLRNEVHQDESRAWDAEISFYRQLRKMLPSGGRVRDIDEKP